MPEVAKETDNMKLPSPTAGEPTHPFEQFLRMLEDGRFHSDLSAALRDLGADLNNHSHAYGGKPKGKLSIEIGFTLNKGIFDITADYKVKKPEAPRERTIAWSTPGNNFVPQNPQQMNLPGVVRDVTSSSRSEVRSV